MSSLKARTVLEEKSSGLFSLEKKFSMEFYTLIRTQISIWSRILLLFFSFFQTGHDDIKVFLLLLCKIRVKSRLSLFTFLKSHGHMWYCKGLRLKTSFKRQKKFQKLHGKWVCFPWIKNCNESGESRECVCTILMSYFYDCILENSLETG